MEDIDDFLDDLTPTERRVVMQELGWVATVKTETKPLRAILIPFAGILTLFMGLLAIVCIVLFPPLSLVLFATAGAPTYYAWRWARPQTVINPPDA